MIGKDAFIDSNSALVSPVEIGTSGTASQSEIGGPKRRPMVVRRHPSLAMIVFYFGRWPPWIEFFVETCKWNPDIHWLLYTDCGAPENRADNVSIRHISFADYKALARRRTGITADPDHPYKLCDLRPALGHIHADDIAGYDFFGFGDLDVFYGHIRCFYTDALLNAYDVLSTHPEIVSGHLAVLRNTDELRRAYERCRSTIGCISRIISASIENLLTSSNREAPSLICGHTLSNSTRRSSVRAAGMTAR